MAFFAKIERYDADGITISTTLPVCGTLLLYKTTTAEVIYNDSNTARKEAFARLEQLRKKGTVIDDDAELASYREDKYGK